MPENKIPYLCGGVLFFLMAHMKPSAGTARDHQSGLKDDHSDPTVMQDLIFAVKGSEYTTAAKDTSNYRECKNNGSVNVPFNDVALCSSYDNAVKNDYSDTLKRMSEFVQSHLDSSKKEWFIKVLLDIIENDADIAETDEFYIECDGLPRTKETIRTTEEFSLPAFLVGIMHYILVNRHDKNILGVATLEAWGQKTPRKPRKYTGNAGESITRNISVSVDIPCAESVSVPVTVEAEPGKTAHDELKERVLASGKVLADIWGGVVEGLLQQPKKEDNLPLTPITPTRYDSNSRIIYLGTDEIVLPVQLVPQSVLAAHELPYINALCEVYAEKISQEVTPDSIDTLPPMYKRHFAEQRKAYYSAESVHRSVREVFADGEQQFSALKDDAYDGIEPTYYDDNYATGYDRLRAVLEKITSTTLTKSALVNIIGLISNLEKKGICHMLVNDERIRSWVVIDDETV